MPAWWRRIPFLAAILIGTLAPATAIVVGPGSAAYASPLASTPLITYNMQGATSGSDSKWTTTVGGYIRAAEIVTLQEAGPTPPGQSVAITTIPALPQVGRAGFIQHNRWQFGHESYEVYFLQTDPNGGSFTGGRNNLAIVTQRPADEITAVPNPVAGARPALGVRFGNDWYFTVHAQALGGQPNDAQALTNAVAGFVAGRGLAEQWTIAGDFNLQPGQFPPPLGSTIYNNGQPTQQNGRELDYAIGSVNIPNHPVTRQPGASADHYAVAVGALRAAAQPQRLFTTPRTLENMQDGAVIETYFEGTSNGTPVTAFRRTGSPTQEWNLEFYANGHLRIRLGEGRCVMPRLDVNALTFIFRPVLQDCTDSGVQQWRLEDVGDEQYEIRSEVIGWCLDVGNSQFPVAVDLHLQSCDPGRPAQHWLLSPGGTPDPTEMGTDTDDLPVAFPDGGLENAATKQLLDHAHRSVFSPVTTTPHHSQQAQPQHFAFDWLGGGVLQIRDPDHNECLAEEDNNGRPSDIVTLTPCNRTDPLQQWTAVPIGENEFRLEHTFAGEPGDPVCLHTDTLTVPDEQFPRMTVCRADYPTMAWYFAPTTTTTLDPS